MTKRAAPSDRPVSDPWRHAFALRLRLASVSGPAIGDALAQVDAHCADTGEEPGDTFGDPQAYADSIAQSLPSSALVPQTSRVSTALSTASTMLGILFLLSGIDAVFHRTPGTISWGALVSVVLVTGLIGVVIAQLDGLAGPRPPWRLFAALAVALAGAMTPPILWPDIAFDAPGWALLAASAVALCTWLPRPGRPRPAPDLIVDPVSGEQTFPAPRLLSVVPWLIPVTLLVAAVALALVPA